MYDTGMLVVRAAGGRRRHLSHGHRGAADLHKGARGMSPAGTLLRFGVRTACVPPQEEYLDGQNKYKCEKCKRFVRARKQFLVANAPRHLSIHLKRFSFGGADFGSGGFGGETTRQVDSGLM